jgi:hypothetical protein
VALDPAGLLIEPLIEHTGFQARPTPPNGGG